jgi:hypothetical protein
MNSRRFIASLCTLDYPQTRLSTNAIKAGKNGERNGDPAANRSLRLDCEFRRIVNSVGIRTVTTPHPMQLPTPRTKYVINPDIGRHWRNNPRSEVELKRSEAELKASNNRLHLALDCAPNSGSNMHRDATELFADYFALSRVNTRANVNTEFPDRVHD